MTTDTLGMILWTAADGTKRTGTMDAMRDSWFRAGQDGTLHTIVDTSVAGNPEPLDVTPRIVSTSFNNVVVDEAKGKAIRAKEQELKDAGFAVADTWYAPGTRMMQIGLDTYLRSYQEWEHRLPAVEVCLSVAEHIEKECRQESVVPLCDLWMDDNGHIGRRGGMMIPMEATMWPRLVNAARVVLPKASELLAVLDPEARAYIWNRQVAKLSVNEAIKIGIRKGCEDDWRVFRVTSTSYSENGGANHVLRTLAKAMQAVGGNFRGTVEYDPATTMVRFDLAHMADPEELDPVVGDFFRHGVSGSTADGSVYGALNVNPFIGRVICVNCTTADSYAPGYRRTHRGDMSELYDGVYNVAVKAPRAMGKFVDDWKVVRDASLDDVDWTLVAEMPQRSAARIQKVDDALRALVHNDGLNVGMGKQALSRALVAAYKAEPGNGSVADVLNAITRASHEGVTDPLVREKLEQRAGQLLPALANQLREGGASCKVAFAPPPVETVAPSDDNE